MRIVYMRWRCKCGYMQHSKHTKQTNLRPHSIYVHTYLEMHTYLNIYVYTCMHYVRTWVRAPKLSTDMTRQTWHDRHDTTDMTRQTWHDRHDITHAHSKSHYVYIHLYIHVYTHVYTYIYTAYCIWSVISPISKVNRWSSSLGLVCHVTSPWIETT